MKVLKEIRRKIDNIFFYYVKIDGMEHLLAGTIIMLLFKYIIPIWIGIIITTIIVIGKEIIYDKLLKQGVFEWKDIIMGIIGMIIAIL